MNYGVICAGGELPFKIANKASESHNVKLILLDGFFTDKRLLEFDNTVIKIAKAGQIINQLKSWKVDKLVIIGDMSMPNLKTLIPDARGLKIISKLLIMKNRGDDSVLRVIAEEIEQEGIEVIDPKIFFEDSDILTKKQPNQEQIADIKLGSEILKKMSDLDIGQGIVVCDGRVVAVEALEGTAEMIKRVGLYSGNRFQGQPILVKNAKSNQDSRLDTPVIGLETINDLQNSGFAGLAIDSRNLIIADIDDFKIKLDQAELFFYDLKNLA